MLTTRTMDYLKPGDIIDIVAPSSKCHSSVLDKIQEFLANWQLGCRFPNDIFGENLLYANSDEKRFEHLKYALTNQTSKAVWCLLGGFGATKVISKLHEIEKPTQSKIFIGFSDITALHIFLQNKWEWATIHGPSGYQASLDKISKDSIHLLKQLLFNETSLVYRQLAPLNNIASNSAIINAPIIGGNLHLIQASLGTFWQINANKKILFIEEVNERAYRIDRILTHLAQAKIFEQVSAIVFGDIIDSKQPNNTVLGIDIVKEFAAQCHLPVLKLDGIGHGTTNNPLFLGKNSRLTTGKSCKLEIL